MSELTSSVSKLEPFLLMAKSAKGAAATKLIENATSAPGVLVFAELLDMPNIQELEQNPQYAPHLSLLKLFSYGTYQDYKEHKDTLPPLSASQLTKLKYLSVVTLASQSRILPYAQLRSYLDITTIRELEDLIIDAMYQDVLRGKLDQKDQQLEIEYTMGRDLRPGQLEDVLVALKAWSTQTSNVIAALDSKIAQIITRQEDEKHDLEQYDEQKNKTLLEIASSKRGGKRGTLDIVNDGDEMDLDPQQPPSQGILSSFIGETFGSRKKKGPPGGVGSGPGSNARKRGRP